MEIIKDFIKQHWNVFSSSWFNFVIAISFFVYVGTLFFYSKKRLIMPVRIINFFLVVSLLLCAFIGCFRGYNFVWDMQDKLYIGFIILFLLSIFLDKILKKHSDIEKIVVLSILFFILFISVNKLEILEYLIVCLYANSKEDKRYLNCIKFVNNCINNLKANGNLDMNVDSLLFNIWEELNEKSNRS